MSRYEGQCQQSTERTGLKEGDDAVVSEIRDIKMISARGVIMTPAVVIDGAKMSEGRIPEVKEIKKWVEEKKEH